MKTKKIVALLCVIAIGSFSSCKKKSNDPEPETETPVAPVNKLCDGNGGTSFYPLDSANAWGYGYKISGMNQSVSPSLKVTGFQMYSSKKYALIEDASNFMFDFYLREDATNHNIYRYNTSNSTEYLEVPASPVINQSWSVGGNSRKVTNLSASINTSSCSYSGLLEISVLNSSSVVIDKQYYKKGLGMVYSLEVGSFAGELSLKSTTLK
ncbi:MAG: hypothetical protein V4677_17875 [Bacteroidota bacterium]